MRKKYIAILILLCLLTNFILSCNNSYKKVEIPTDSPYKGTIKIPNEWEFVNDSGVITLIDSSTKEVIAEQIYQEWRISIKYGDGTVEENWDSLTFNSNINLDISNKDNYSVMVVNSNSAYIHKYDDGTNQRFCINFDIYNTDKKGSYVFFLMFSENVDYEEIKKMAKSYSWGGYH